MGILTHRFVSAVADGPYTTQVQPSNWNEPHSFTGGTHGAILTRDTTTASSSEGVAWVSTPTAPGGQVLVSPSSSAAPAWWQRCARVSSQVDVTTSTLANASGLSLSIVNGRVYQFEAVLYTTSSSASGIKFAIGGTASASAIIYQGIAFDSTVIAAHTRATSLATAVCGVNNTVSGFTRICGTITASGSGTLTVQFAQNTSSASTSSLLVGSTFEAWQIA